MKILISTGIFPPSIGGPATYSKLLTVELPKRGIDVAICTFDSVRSFPRIIRNLVYFFIILFKSIGSDIIYAQDPVSVGLPSMIVAKMLRKKFFVRVAGDYAWEQSVQRFGVKDNINDFQNKKYGFFVSVFKSIQGFVVSRSDTVITPSDYFKKLVNGWSAKIKVKRIYNGIDLSYNIPKNENYLVNRLKISRDSFVISTAGRLLPWKGFSELIDIFSLSNMPNNVVMVIMGDGPGYEELKIKIDRLGLNKRVFLLGKLNREDMFATLHCSNVFVLNTGFESFSFQIVEAMLAGLPVLASNVGSIPELICDNQNGYIFEYKNIKEISEKVLLLYNDTAKANQFGNNSINLVKKFSVQFTIDQLIEEFKLKL